MIKELGIWLFGAICGWVVSTVLEYAKKRAARKYSVQKAKRKDSEYKQRTFKDCIPICRGVPFFRSQNIRTRRKIEDVFYISFPNEIKSEMNLKDGLEIESFSRCDSNSFFRAFNLPGYSDEDVKNALSISRMKIAKQMAERENGLYFNSKMYGVYSSDAHQRTPDAKEEQIYYLRVFETDYFTHRVVGEALDILKVPTETFAAIEGLNASLNWTRTSFGLSIIVVLPKSNEIILTKRSKNAAYSGGKELYYVSVTETLSATDLNLDTNCPDLECGVIRGLKEELGIDRNLLDLSSLRFYDSFYETRFHQDNITASISLKSDVSYSNVLECVGKDRDLEVNEFLKIDNTPKAIQRFINEHRDASQAQTIFTLESYKSRLEDSFL